MVWDREASLEQALADVQLDMEETGENLNVWFCYGPPRCTTGNSTPDFTACRWCYRVSGRDTRPAVMILEDIDRAAGIH